MIDYFSKNKIQILKFSVLWCNSGMESKFSKHLPIYNMLFWFMELENWKKYVSRCYLDQSSVSGSSVSMPSRLMAIKEYNFF